MREVSIEAEDARCNEHKMDRWRQREKRKRGGRKATKGIMSEKAHATGTEIPRIPLVGSRRAAVLRCLVQETNTAVFKHKRNSCTGRSLNAGQPFS